MTTNIALLKDHQNTIYPKTLTTAVFDATGTETVAVTLSGISDEIDDIHEDLADVITQVEEKLPKVFTNISASSWATDSTYSEWPYRCALTCQGVTASDVAQVVFTNAQATSGKYAPICESYAGGIYIYGIDPTSITIPAIVVTSG